MKQHHVPHTGICAGVGKNITGRRDKEDFRALSIKTGFHLYTGDLFNIIGKEIHHVLIRMGLNSKVVPCSVTVGHRCGNPVYVEAD